MARIKLFLMRHSKSCSNHVRQGPGREQLESDIELSQSLRDPGLTVDGARVASKYGPVLLSRLKRQGFDVDHCMIGSSHLRRARETARLVFRKSPSRLPHFTENGAIPENTPAASRYTPPDWDRFVAHLSTLVHEGQSVVVVGHGSFLGSLWPLLTGRDRKERLNNLDGILVDMEVSPQGGRVHGAREIRCPLHVDPGIDQCALVDRQKITTLRRRMAPRQRKTQQRKTRQRGGNGSVGMPLAYFQPGAQFEGTSSSATGVGLAGMTSGWVRTPMGLTGGARRSRRTQRQQAGGFSPSVMGAFASAGSRLLPLAGYLGYKQYSNEQSALQKSRRSRSQRRSRSRSRHN